MIYWFITRVCCVTHASLPGAQANAVRTTLRDLRQVSKGYIVYSKTAFFWNNIADFLSEVWVILSSSWLVAGHYSNICYLIALFSKTHDLCPWQDHFTKIKVYALQPPHTHTHLLVSILQYIHQTITDYVSTTIIYLHLR